MSPTSGLRRPLFITSSRTFRRWVLKVLSGRRILRLTWALLTCEHLVGVKNSLLVGTDLNSVESGGSLFGGQDGTAPVPPQLPGGPESFALGGGGRGEGEVRWLRRRTSPRKRHAASASPPRAPPPTLTFNVRSLPRFFWHFQASHSMKVLSVSGVIFPRCVTLPGCSSGRNLIVPFSGPVYHPLRSVFVTRLSPWCSSDARFSDKDPTDLPHDVCSSVCPALPGLSQRDPIERFKKTSHSFHYDVISSQSHS